MWFSIVRRENGDAPCGRSPYSRRLSLRPAADKPSEARRLHSSPGSDRWQSGKDRHAAH